VAGGGGRGQWWSGRILHRNLLRVGVVPKHWCAFKSQGAWLQVDQLRQRVQLARQCRAPRRSGSRSPTMRLARGREAMTSAYNCKRDGPRGVEVT